MNRHWIQVRLVFLWGCGLTAGLCLTASPQSVTNLPGGGSEGPDVTATIVGDNVVFGNGIVTDTLRRGSAELLSLRYQGHEFIHQRGRHHSIYFALNSDKGYDIIRGSTLSVTRQTPDMVDLSCKRVYSPSHPTMCPADVDIHFVLRRGASGIYVYAILDHPADYPDLNVSVWNMVWSMPENQDRWLMENIYVDEARHWEMPSPYDFDRAEQTGIKEIVKLTTGPWKGRYDCKYMYSASFWDIGCWGYASDRNKVGAWVVLGSAEYFNDGPTQADLNAASGGVLALFSQIHYNGSGITIPRGEAWRKIYGPYLLYCNSSPEGGEACWRDAQRQVKAEQAAWPYDWLSGNILYPSRAQRGGVRGRFVVQDGLKPGVSGAGAWIGLAQPETGGNWQFDSKRYQHWVRTDTNGAFTIPNARPGAWTLYAFTTGATGEFARTNVLVSKGATNDLGELTWRVPHRGARLAWEIGVPDRTAKEFRHGDDYFQPYMWEKFAGEMANPLEYTVGVSDWSRDWNYVQCGYLKDGKWSPWKWRIHFNLTNAPANGDATLTLAYASSYYGRTEVYVNDETRMLCLVHPSVDGGNALIREGIHAKYCVEQVPVPLSLLKPGTNTITLVQGANRFDRPFFHVMYDYLSLELPAAAP